MSKGYGMEPKRESNSEDPVVLVGCADDGYAMPLTVALHSALRTLDRDRSVEVFIVDGGLSPRNLARCRRCLASAHPRVRIEVVTPDLSRLSHVPTYEFPVAAYFRLLIPQLLSERYRRALYLDCDVVVTEDLSPLWDLDLQDRAVWAVPDDDRPDELFARITRDFPFVVFEEGATYFNSGVLLINLPVWRQLDISERALEFLRSYPDKCLSADQDALNLAIAGGWGRLPEKWNNQVRALWHSSDRWKNPVAYERLVFAGIAERFDGDRILHFIGIRKPWSVERKGPYRDRFVDALGRSGFYARPRQMLWLLNRSPAGSFARAYRRKIDKGAAYLVAKL